MPKHHKPSLPADAYPGNFATQYVTLRKTKHFAGGNYQLIGGDHVADRWSHLVKSPTGQSDWFDHAVVMDALIGYWEPEPKTEEVPA